jgi:hypothetical protein
MIKRNMTYPELRSLKGKYNLSLSELGEVIGGKNNSALSRKFHLHTEFKYSEMLRITKFFESLGEKVTPESLFLDWISTEDYLEIFKKGA